MSRKTTAATELIDKLHDTIGKLKWLLASNQISKSDIKNLRHSAKPLNSIGEGIYGLTQTSEEKQKAIQGIFDGKDMVTASDTYPVPANYASKSMLIPGDTLKLSIKADGEMMYKLIKSAPRKHLKGILHKKGVITMALWSDNENYMLNSAAVTFHKWKPGDNVSIIINAEEAYPYAALECVFREA